MTTTDLYQMINKPQSMILWLVLLCLPSTAQAAAEVRRSTSVEDKVDQLEKQLQTANRMRAEFQFQLTNLQKEIRDLRGIIEEQSFQMEQMTARQRDIFRELDTLRNQQQSSTDTSSTDNPNLPPDIPGSDTETPIEQPVTTTISEADIRAQYDAIFPLVRANRYDEAIVEYQKFIAAYPDSDMVSNARYWLAQIYNVQGRNNEAEREYLIVIQQYPDARRAPDSMLKLGEIYEARGDQSGATQYFEQVIEQYPTSNAARFAQKKLEELDS